MTWTSKEAVRQIARTARQQIDAAVIVQFQRAADSYAFQHRQTERRGTSPAPAIEGAFFGVTSVDTGAQ